MASETSDLLHHAYADLRHMLNELHGLRDIAIKLSKELKTMASIHDQIAAVFDDIEPKVGVIIDAKTNSDSANADLLTRAQALQTKIDAAAATLTSGGPAAAGSTAASIGAALGTS